MPDNAHGSLWLILQWHVKHVICTLLMWPPFFSGPSLHMAYYRMPWYPWWLHFLSTPTRMQLYHKTWSATWEPNIWVSLGLRAMQIYWRKHPISKKQGKREHKPPFVETKIERIHVISAKSKSTQPVVISRDSEFISASTSWSTSSQRSQNDPIEWAQRSN